MPRDAPQFSSARMGIAGHEKDYQSTDRYISAKMPLVRNIIPVVIFSQGDLKNGSYGTFLPLTAQEIARMAYMTHISLHMLQHSICQAVFVFSFTHFSQSLKEFCSSRSYFSLQKVILGYGITKYLILT